MEKVVKNCIKFLAFFYIIWLSLLPIKAATLNYAVERKIIIKLKSNITPNKVLAAINSYTTNQNLGHFTSLTSNDLGRLKELGNFLFLNFSNQNININQIINQLKNDSKLQNLIEYIEPLKPVQFYNWQTILNKDYPGDFDTPTSPLAARHWYLERINMPQFWHIQGCANNSETCYPASDTVIAIIDTGLAVSGSSANPEQAQFTYTNVCDDTGCLLPVNQSGELTFQITYAKSGYLPNSILWTNPNEANTPECNDLHGVDMEMYFYNNAHNISTDCNNENRQKEGIPADDYGHGSFIAHEIAGAIDDTTTPSVIGIAPNVKIMPIKVNVPFRGFFYTDRLAAAILYAVDNGAKIINISAGTNFDSNIVRDAISYAKDHGVIIVASSGNSGADSLAYPAAYTEEFENVIAVGALDENLERAPYSNYKTGYTIYAPVGKSSSDAKTSIVSTSISCSANNSCVPAEDNGIYKLDVSSFSSVAGIGTSFAAPQVAALSTLLLSYNPALTGHDIRNILTENQPLTGSPEYLDVNIVKGINTFFYSAHFIKGFNDFGNQGDIWYIGDFNGDGHDDISLVRLINSTTARWYVALTNSSGTALTNVSIWHNDFGNKGDLWYVGDFNGDGKKDLALTRLVTNTIARWYVAISDGNQFTNTHILYFDFGNKGDKWYTGDFNGDHYTDIALVRVSGNQAKWYVALNKGDASATLNAPKVWHFDIGNQGDKWYIGDFNGDGKDDLAVLRLSSDNKAKWYVSLSTGHSFKNPTVWHEDFGNKGDTWYVSNFTSDNEADIVITRPFTFENNQYQRVYLATSTGNNFEAYKYLAPRLASFSHTLYIGDFNGDGLTDFAGLQIVNSTTCSWYFNLLKPPLNTN